MNTSTYIFTLIKKSDIVPNDLYGICCKSKIYVFKEFFEFFEQCGNKEFITFEDTEIPENKFNWIKYYYFFGRLDKNSKLMKVLEYISLTIQKIIEIDRIKGNKTKYMNGDNWFSITNELAEYVLSQSAT